MEWQAQEVCEEGRGVGSFVPEEFRELAVESKAGGFSLWVKVLECVPEPMGARFEVVAQPFALAGELRQRWVAVALGAVKAA